ncbi:MAG: hypothetical protein FDX21_04675 [Chlorobium sp.]|nr:MAG: hypothetical protein FDX21_04675 [Chlorobium sp.]
MKPEKMMKQHDDNIEAEVRKTMDLLDELAPLEVHHQFRVRLMQRIDNEIGQEKHIKYPGFRIDYRLAFMVLLLAVNLGSTMLSVRQGDETITTISEVPVSQSEDYSNQEFAYYDQTASYENQTP